MKNRIVAAIICIFFVHVTTSSAQMLDINPLDALQELQGSRQDFNELPDTERNNNQIEETEKEEESKIEDEIEDNFGYKGRNDFLLAPKPKLDDLPLEFFGYDYFAQDEKQFLPAKDIPIPPDYVIGPGDILKILLFGNENEKFNLQVTREGDIFMPQIGPISVAGLTFKDLKETIEQIIDNQLIGTKVSLTLGNLRSINIFVLGEASKPGMYTVSALSTLTNAVFTSGGIKNTGSLRNIQLKRNGVIISDFDFYDLLLKGDTSSDLRLMSGDVIFIPPTEKTVGISGEVKRPGIYELKDNENAEDLINFAGNFRSKADLSSIEIQRIDSFGDGFNLLNVDLDPSIFKDLALKNGDKLSIYPVVEKLSNAILVTGHFRKPGFYPWFDGMTILDIVQSKDDLLRMTDMNYILIKRESPLDLSYEIFQLNLEDLFDANNPKENISLQDRDEVIFFPSMLKTNLIKTVVTENEYDNQNDQLALLYAKKSLDEFVNQKELQPLATNQANQINQSQLNNSKYFHYSVYSYCILDNDFLAKLLVFAEELGPFYDQTQSNKELTQFCRRQILDPIISIIEQQASPNNPEQTITIFGNVAFPGKYPLAKNATIADGLAASGGLQGLSYMDEIDISKKSYPGKELVETSQLSEYSLIENTPLDSLDIITVKRLSYSPATVSIEGEVYFPGTYPISEDETFTSLIDRAGGFTDQAGIGNTFFQRRSLIESEIQRFNEAQDSLKRQLLLAGSSQSFGNADDSAAYIDRLMLLAEKDLPESSMLGRLVIDIEAMINNPSKNISLINGDRIVIPRIPQTIKVIGEVYAPNSHIFNDEYSANDYIDLSGGLNDFADRRNAYIIKPTGSVISLASSGGFFRDTSSSIQPGDTLVIPIKINTFSGLKATTEVTQIIYQMALAAAAVNSF